MNARGLGTGVQDTEEEMSDERRAEIERQKQPGAILRDAERAIRLHAREDEGRFGEDGLDLDTAVKIIGILRDELVAALGRVRDARGEGGLCPECQLPARDGEHQLGCSRNARGDDEAAQLRARDESLGTAEMG